MPRKVNSLIFVDIVSMLFLVILMVVNFFSIYYITNGDKGISALVSVIIVVAYYFIVNLLKRFKERMTKAKYLDYSSFFWLFFIVISAISFYLMMHILTIEINCKQLVQTEANKKLDIIQSEVDAFKTTYNRDLTNYQSNLIALLQNYKNGNSGIKEQLLKAPYSIRVENLSDRSNIQPISMANDYTKSKEKKRNIDFARVDSLVANKINNQRLVFNNWERFNIMENYNQLNIFIYNSRNIIHDLLLGLPYTKSISYSTFSNTQLPLNNPEELREKFPFNPILPILLIVLTHLFILIPFINEPVSRYNCNKFDDIGAKTY